jgi:cytochrome c oxidase subunit IV
MLSVYTIICGERRLGLSILSIILTAGGVVAIFLAASAYMKEGRFASAGAVIMPIGLVIAAIGILLLFIPDFFARN